MKKIKVFLALTLCLIFFSTQAPAQTISGTQYVEKKARGLVQTLKIGNSFALAVSKFSEDDGTEIQPEVFAIGINQLEVRKQQLHQEILNLQILIDDLKALQVVEP